MSMLTRARSLGRHRGKTPAQLRSELDTATCHLVAMATEIDELKAARNRLEAQLDEAGIDYSGALDDLRKARGERDDWRDQALRLRAKFGPQLAAEANANRITVPPMIRDTSAVEDQATGPIDVTTLWAARDAGRLGPVTDPSHINTH